MTTRHSPIAALKKQADAMAAMIKKAERGERVDVRFAEKVAAARRGPTFKVGIVMDDKVITLDLPWTTISTTSEVGLSEYIVQQMREARHDG